jgi:hypothetical protein
MKKFAVVLFVALLGLALTVPASALEHQFGGYWRVRMYNNTDFDGVDNDVSRDKELQQADTRTRLYYTAIINENLKFVNKFEMDAVWGDSSSYGDIGADGVNVEVKNSYVDFNLGPANAKIGTQGAALHRGFLFDDDFSGVVVGVAGLTAVYVKAIEAGDGSGDDDQVYRVSYDIGGDAFKIAPSITYDDQADGDSAWFLGVDADGNAGALGYWATLIYEGGEYGVNTDRSAFLVDLGVSVGLSDALGIHAEAFYATGDDDATDDEDNAFAGFGGNGAGQSKYWGEIMGYGLIDADVSNGSCADKISNILAANLGVSFGVTEKLTLGADIWWAQLAEDDANGEKDLGTEIDLSAGYTIVEGLKLDMVAAYLLAGDATTGGVADDANPFELGAQFSISF